MFSVRSGRSFLLLSIFSIAFVFILGCAQLNSRPGSEEGTTGSSFPWVPLFPHPEDWGNPALHGVGYQQYGLTACLNCHKVNSTQAEAIPACQSCHPLFPHADHWGNKEVHGKYVMTNGKSSCATQCHGVDFQGGLSNISCNACHTIYPHKPGWVLPTAHGATALGDGKNSCKGCHGEDLQGGDSGVSCYNCHSSYPHDTAWLGAHGNYVNSNSSTSCATERCHGVNLIPNPGVTMGPSCSSCHASYPHSYTPPLDWRLGTLHGPVAMADINQCKLCHGSQLNLAPIGFRSCSSTECHPSYPLHNSAQVSSVNWNTDASAGHGRYVLNPPTNGDLTECKKCHGSDFEGGISAKPCRTCHETFPYRHRDASGNIDPNWGLNTGHGTYLYFNLSDSSDHPNNPNGVTNKKRQECSKCHGAKLATSGGGSGVSCQSCHSNAVNDPMDVFSCNICHRGAHPLYIPTRVSCLACHVGIDPSHEAGQSKCTKCHKAHTWMPPITP